MRLLTQKEWENPKYIQDSKKKHFLLKLIYFIQNRFTYVKSKRIL
jgi:hypothetical protein